MADKRVRIRLLASTGTIVREERKELGYWERTTKEVLEGYNDLNNRDVENDQSEAASNNSNSSPDSSSYDDLDEDSDKASTSSLTSNQYPDGPADPIPQYGSAIQEAQLSPGGTCIFTTDPDRTFAVYPIDQDILEAESPRSLYPYAQLSSNEPIWAFAVNPYFNLNDSSTTEVLVSSRAQYISLHNALWDVSQPSPTSSTSDPGGPINISTKLASYKLINPLTEEVIAPLSLTYTNDGTHFIAGSQNQISIFDLSYTDEPITKIRTIPSGRNNLKDGGRGYKGHISSLSVSASSDILAAGTWTRQIGLYDLKAFGEQITHFPLPSERSIHGHGVSQLKWSPCDKYLYIAERNSDALLIYDVRKFSLCLAYCIGRNAITKQKMGFDIWETGAAESGHEVWAGGVDGSIRVWKNPHLKGGAVEADEMATLGDVPVASTLVHPYGSLAVAAKACRMVGRDGKGKVRGSNGVRPVYKERGCLDLLGLMDYGGGSS